MACRHKNGVSESLNIIILKYADTWSEVNKSHEVQVLKIMPHRI